MLFYQRNNGHVARGQDLEAREPYLDSTGQDESTTLPVYGLDDMIDGETKTVVHLSGTKRYLTASTLQKLEPFLTTAATSVTNAQTGVTEYFIERDVTCFAAILDFHQVGELHMPSSVCPNVYKRELQFWDVDWRLMKACCLRKFVGFLDSECCYFC